MALIFRECPFCLNPSMVLIPDEDLARYNAGALIQDAMPDVSEDDRELFKTGIHPSCWDELLYGEADLGGEG